jgi:ammonium transporter, Amt family
MTTGEKWKFFGTMMLGKAMAIGVLAAIIMFSHAVFSPAHAADTYTDHETAMMNTANTIWTLVAAFLVFGMQPGFVFLEAGFARSKEVVNILLECIFDTCLCGIAFWAFGYAFMFSEGTPFIGTHWFCLMGAPPTYEATGIPILAHWIFQFAFADTCSTVTSGAMIGRTGFRGDILYSLGTTGFIYPIVGHWAWGPDGWLALMGSKDHFFPALGQGFRDFAGSTVVHTIGGVISLTGSMVLGPRLGRIFARDDKARGGQMPPHNLTIAAVGGFILWFGWYGFNPGSTLSAMDMQGISRVAANTTIAACGGGFSAMFIALMMGPTKGKFDLGFSLNGFLGGLVAITCPCYWVSMGGALAIGLVAGLVVFFGVQMFEWFRIDDPVGAVSVHGLAGIWGTLSLGLFARNLFGATGPTGADNSSPVAGVFYGGGWSVFEAQLIGNGCIVIATFVISYVMMKIIRMLPDPWNLRVEKEGELGAGGLDVWEHGIEAYPVTN